MELSEPVAVSRGLALLSDGGAMLATAQGPLVEIRSVESMSPQHAVELPSAVTCLSWGAVGGEPALAAGSAGTGSVAVLSATTGEIIADILTGAIGLAALSLSDGGLLLAFAECGLGVTVVDIPDGAVRGLLPDVRTGGGALPVARAHAWAPGGRFAAVVAHEPKHGDCALILDAVAGCVPVRAPAGAALGGVSEVGGIAWAGPRLLVWGGALDPLGDRAMALLTPDGRLLRKGAPEPVDERDYACDGGLGIRALSVSDCGGLLAVGGWNGVLRVVTVEQWTEVAAFDHGAPAFDAEAPPALFRENARAHARLAATFELVHEVEHISVAVGGAQARELKQGVAIVEFARWSKFLASVADSSRNVLFIWSVAKLRLAAVLVLQADIVSVAWATTPSGPACVVVTGGDHVYVWKEEGAAAVRVEEATRGRGGRKRTLAKILTAPGKHAAVVVDSAKPPGGACVGVYFV